MGGNILGFSLLAAIASSVFLSDRAVAAIAHGILKWLGIGLGIIVFALVCAGFVHAIGLVPFLLLCLLFQGSARRT